MRLNNGKERKTRLQISFLKDLGNMYKQNMCCDAFSLLVLFNSEETNHVHSLKPLKCFLVVRSKLRTGILADFSIVYFLDHINFSCNLFCMNMHACVLMPGCMSNLPVLVQLQ